MGDFREDVFELSLLENGIDFILRGIDELFDESNVLRGFSVPKEISRENYKYGTLHIFSGLLLLLKERLARHLPELMYVGKISDVKRKLSEKRVVHTVNLDEALERLEIGPRVTFSDDEIKVIKDMQKYRNNFEHFRVSVNKNDLYKTIAEFLNLIDRFLVNELEITLESSTDSFELFQKIQLIEAAWQRIEENRKQDINSELQRNLEKFQLNRDEIIKSLERDYIRDKGVYILYIVCPSCYDETIIAHGEFAGICSNPDCEEIYPLTTCDRCGNIITGYSWEYNFCNSCRLHALDDK